jgi:hypothetical protein
MAGWRVQNLRKDLQRGDSEDIVVLDGMNLTCRTESSSR